MATNAPGPSASAGPDPAEIESALGLWPGTAGGRASLINLSENHTYRLDAPAGTFVLRVHRPGYQSRTAIESELAWLSAVSGIVPVPRPIAGRDGQMVQQIGERCAVLFAFEPGSEPAETGELGELFRTLGDYAARLHDQASRWPLPSGFSRPVWSIGAMLDPDGLWGDWRAAPHVDGEIRRRLDRLDQRLRDALGAYGRTPDRFGLVHADMRLANLLVAGRRVMLLDFDDCGFCWFLYDLAASLSFIEMRADLMDLVAAWTAGYAAVRPLSPEDRAMIVPMILLRRMVLLAWIGSHGETDLARRHAPVFARDTADLADRIWPR